MAIDKLSVLRRDKECYEILLLSKDLKSLTKERRNQLISFSEERPSANEELVEQQSENEDEEMACAEDIKNEDGDAKVSSDIEQPECKQTNNRKRKKRK